MKRTLALGTALALAIVSAGVAAAADVVVYAALDKKTIEEIAQAFKEATGLTAEIALQIEQAGTIASRVQTEAANPRADIFIGGNSSIHDGLAKGGFLAQYVSPEVAKAGIAKKFMDPGGFWSGWYLGALAVLVNEKRFQAELQPKGLKLPATWDDLLNPAYKGEVIAANPATTGGAVIFMATQIFRLGSEEKGFQYIAELHKNVSQYTPGANGSIPLVAQGQAIAGIAWGHDLIRQKKAENLPVAVVFPRDNGYEIGAVSILKGAKNQAAARKFVDFILTPRPMEINARNGLRYPVRGGVRLPEGVPAFESLHFVDYDQAKVAANLDAWKKRWAQITGK
ncbi:MAG: extracellular solute-binding protein [Candidatus Methylomirabilales bacterium]